MSVMIASGGRVRRSASKSGLSRRSRDSAWRRSAAGGSVLSPTWSSMARMTRARVAVRVGLASAGASSDWASRMPRRTARWARAKAAVVDARFSAVAGVGVIGKFTYSSRGRVVRVFADGRVRSPQRHGGHRGGRGCGGGVGPAALGCGGHLFAGGAGIVVAAWVAGSSPATRWRRRGAVVCCWGGALGWGHPHSTLSRQRERAFGLWGAEGSGGLGLLLRRGWPGRAWPHGELHGGQPRLFGLELVVMASGGAVASEQWVGHEAFG